MNTFVRIITFLHKFTLILATSKSIVFMIKMFFFVNLMVKIWLDALTMHNFDFKTKVVQSIGWMFAIVIMLVSFDLLKAAILGGLLK